MQQSKEYSRREFLSNISTAGAMAGILGLGISCSSGSNKEGALNKMGKSIHIKSVDADFEREPLIRP